MACLATHVQVSRQNHHVFAVGAGCEGIHGPQCLTRSVIHVSETLTFTGYVAVSSLDIAEKCGTPGAGALNALS